MIILKRRWNWKEFGFEILSVSFILNMKQCHALEVLIKKNHQNSRGR